MLARRRATQRKRPLEPPKQYPVPPERQRTRAGRRRTAAERAKEQRIHVGDIIDLHRWCRCGRGHGRFEVLSAIELGHYGMLRCCGCGRNGGWLTRAHFEGGGRHLMD